MRSCRGKTAVGEMGYVAYFTDSEGNVVGLWQGAARASGGAMSATG